MEVLWKNEVPSGAWSSAEIISSNRYNVTVRYDMGVVDEPVVERVPRNLVRPCPPSLGSPESWIPGDVIEVLHNHSWKMAAVLKVLMKNQYIVRLVGSLHELKVHKVETRIRQSWLDGKWVLVGQDSGNNRDQGCNGLSSRNFYKLPSQVKTTKRKLDLYEERDSLSSYKRTNFQESCIVSPETIKRGSTYFYPYNTTHQGDWQSWLIEKDGEHNQVAALDASQEPGDVGKYGYTGQLQGQFRICSPIDNGMMHLVEENAERQIMQGGNLKCCSRSLENDDPDASSVGSCSITGNRHFRVLGYPFGDADDHTSDAESVIQLHTEDGNCLVPNKEELAAEIHRLELHAYRCTMEAFHASGPLSWERESLITNLRISLHISNDEHLLELRNLISDATS